MVHWPALFCAMTVHGSSSLLICSSNDTLTLTYPALWYKIHTMENRQRGSINERMKNHLHTIQKRFPGYTGQETAGGRWTGQCLLWSLKVMDPKNPHIFPDTLSLLYSGPASRPYVLCFTLPKHLDCLLQTTTSYHRTPAVQWDPEARPLIYKTLMAVFSNSVHFTVEPSTLQESNLTWRPWAHSHRFHPTGTGQVAPPSLSATVYLFTPYLNVIKGF